jgi:hypothetical protein
MVQARIKKRQRRFAGWFLGRVLWLWTVASMFSAGVVINKQHDALYQQEQTNNVAYEFWDNEQYNPKNNAYHS